MKINPTAITNFNRSEAELQTFLIFCICVAGKNADQTAHKVGKLCQDAEKQGLTPFQYFKENKNFLHNMLVANRIGQYIRIEKAIEGCLDLDLRTCTVEDLQKIHGIGPKTSRFFLVHSRRDVKCAILDTHLLRWLSERWKLPDVPKSTPSGEKYLQLEKIALSLMNSDFPKLSVAEADLLVWTQMSGRLDD